MHRLRPGFKVIFACERRWIFHTVILDENDREVRFHWSGLNMHRRQLHPPQGTFAHMLVLCGLPEIIVFGNLHLCYGFIHCFLLLALQTSCLPSSISHEGTVLQFGHLHLLIVQIRLVNVFIVFFCFLIHIAKIS